jgi:hypothetical protein
MHLGLCTSVYFRAYKSDEVQIRDFMSLFLFIYLEVIAYLAGES